MTPGLVHVPGRDGAAWIGADRVGAGGAGRVWPAGDRL